MKDVYEKLFNSPAPKLEAHEIEPWVEPVLPEAIPKDIRKAIVDTAFMDRKKRIDRVMEVRAETQRSYMQDAARYGQGMRNVGMLGANSTASGIAAQQQQAMQNMQGRLTPEVWSKKLLDNLSQSVFKPEEKIMGDEYENDGVMRIGFPFGQVEMPIANESELERAFEMAKHMLKVHEEMTATGAIKRNIRKSKNKDKVSVSNGSSNFGGLSGSPIATNGI